MVGIKFIAENFEYEDSSFTLFGHEYSTYCVKTYLPLNPDQCLTIGFNPSSSLYPEYIGRNTKDGEIAHDLYMGHCNWYIWDKPKTRQE